MQVMFPNCAGSDVHKKFVMACRRRIDAHGHTSRDTRRGRGRRPAHPCGVGSTISTSIRLNPNICVTKRIRA
jgi:hypothetical protein